MNYFSISIVLCIMHFGYVSPLAPLEVANTDDYTFSMGYSTLSPDENVKDFFKHKSAYENNLYDDKYFVVVQFSNPPSKVDNYNGMRQEIDLIQKINDVTYIASFAKKTSRRTFKKFHVRAIVPISDNMKLEQGLKEHITVRKTVKVNIVVSKSIEKSYVARNLKQLGVNGASEIFKETTNKYMITVDEQQFKDLSSYPWIVQIEAGGLR